MQQINHMHQSISLKHVIFVLPQAAENTDYLDRPFDSYAKVFNLLLGADQDSFANIDETWYELELTE